MRSTPALALLLLGSIAPAVANAQAAQPKDVFDQFFRYTQKENKVFFSQMPGETVDPFTGTLRISQVDISLPGKAGLDLQVIRTYSSKVWDRADSQLATLLAEQEHSFLGFGWSMHFGRLKNPNGSGTELSCAAVDAPIYEAPDGTARVFYPCPSCAPALGVTVFRSKDYWRLERPCSVATTGIGACVFSTDGVRHDFSSESADAYHFGPGLTLIWPTRTIVDPHGNQISITYKPKSGAFGVGAPETIVDTYGRVLTFDYHNSADGRRLDSVTVNNKQYRYCYTPKNSVPARWAGTACAAEVADEEVCPDSTGVAQDTPCGRDFLTRVVPPAGEPYAYEYATATDVPHNQFALSKLKYPAGGTTAYSYESRGFFTGFERVNFPVVRTRTTGGRGVPAGTWTYEYESPNAGSMSAEMQKTTITRPDNLRDEHYTFGFAYPANRRPAFNNTWRVGLTQKVCHAATGPDCANALMTEELDWDNRASAPVAALPYAAPIYTATVNCTQAIKDTSVFAPALKKRTTKLKDDSTSYVTDYSNYDDFGQAQTVTESGQATRTTTSTYFYFRREQQSGINMVRGRPLTQHICVGGASSCYDNGWTYRPTGVVKTQTSNGVTTSFDHDADGNLWTVINAIGQTLTLTGYVTGWGLPAAVNFNGPIGHSKTAYVEGWLKSDTDGRGHKTDYTYDALGRVKTITPPKPSANAATIYDYAPTQSGCTGIATAAGSTRLTRGLYFKTTNVDGLGRQSSTCDSEGVVTTVRYDSMARNVFTSYPRKSGQPEVGERTQLDGLDRTTVLTRGCELSSGTTLACASGRPETSDVVYAWANNCLTTTVTRTATDKPRTIVCFESFGDPNERRLTVLTDAAGKVWRYAYTPRGELKTLDAPAAGVANGDRSYVRNPVTGFLESETSAESGPTKYEPNTLLQLTARVDSRGSRVEFDYRAPNGTLDPLSRLRTTKYPGGTTSDDVTQDYDAANNITALSSVNGGTYSTTYDELNRPTLQTWAIDGRVFTTKAQYDDSGCLRQLEYPTGGVVAMLCDTANRPKTVSAPTFTGFGTPTIAGDTAKPITYNAFGGFNSLPLGNGLSTSFSVDSRGRPKSMSTPGALSLGYREYDGADNLKKLEVTYPTLSAAASERVLSYDSLDRLETATGPWGAASFVFDELGNRKHYDKPTRTLAFGYNAENQLANAVGGAKPLSKPLGLTWDKAGRLAATTDGTTYRYDGLGRRVVKIETFPCTGTPFCAPRFRVTYYHYDFLGRLIAETDGLGQKGRDYYYVGDRLIAVDGGLGDPAPPLFLRLLGQREWYHTDVTGSVLARTDALGRVTATIDYEPFGELLKSTGQVGTRLFNGRVFDEGTGFYDYGARPYFAGIGRFIGPDSDALNTNLPQTSNPYSYVFNSPYKFTDPSGRVPFLVITAGVGAVIGGGVAAYQNRDLSGWAFARAVLRGAGTGAGIGAGVGGIIAFGVAGSATASVGAVVKGSSAIAAGILGIGGKVASDRQEQVKGATTTLFRAVSPAEHQQLMDTGRFAQGPGSLGGKFFGETAADAAKWGDKLQGSGNYRVISVELQTKAADALMRWDRLDSIGPARYGELDQLVGGVVRNVQ